MTVQGCKFVDEVRRRCARRASRSAWPRRAPRAQVVPECPYVMNDEYLSMIFDKYKIDYVVHGDDPCIVDGKVRPQHTRAPAALSRNRHRGPRRMCTRTRSTWANTARSREPKAFRPQTLSAECCCSRATTTTRSARSLERHHRCARRLRRRSGAGRGADYKVEEQVDGNAGVERQEDEPALQLLDHVRLFSLVGRLRRALTQRRRCMAMPGPTLYSSSPRCAGPPVFRADAAVADRRRACCVVSTQPMRVKPKGAKVVYIDGAWDMFHAGTARRCPK